MNRLQRCFDDPQKAFRSLCRIFSVIVFDLFYSLCRPQKQPKINKLLLTVIFGSIWDINSGRQTWRLYTRIVYIFWADVLPLLWFLTVFNVAPSTPWIYILLFPTWNIVSNDWLRHLASVLESWMLAVYHHQSFSDIFGTKCN